MSEICVFINLFLLCAAMVSHCQPPSKCLGHHCYKTVKRIQKLHLFSHFRKSQWVNLGTNYLKFTTRQNWIRYLYYFHWKTLFYGIFWYNLKSYCISLVLSLPQAGNEQSIWFFCCCTCIIVMVKQICWNLVWADWVWNLRWDDMWLITTVSADTQ